MHRNSSSLQQAPHFSPFITRENPYKEWGMWGGIFTALSVVATIAFSAFGIAFGWPLAIAILGALFTAVAVATAHSHNKTSERNEYREHEKTLEHQQEIEKQIQKDKEVARQMQMKKEEAQMEEAMRIVRTEGRTYTPNAQNNPAILQYLQNTINSCQLFNQSQLDATWRGIINIANNNNLIGSSNIGFTKDGKISEIQINGGEIYKATSKKEEKELNNMMQR